MTVVSRTLWGIDASVLYDSMDLLAEIGRGNTVLDVPCGGGVAFRALPSGHDVRYVAIDIDERMLARARARALRRGARVEFVAGDMLALPFDDDEADLVLSYSGLHMVSDPERAVRELARCLEHRAPNRHDVPRRRDTTHPGAARNRRPPGASVAAGTRGPCSLADGCRHRRCAGRPSAWVRCLRRSSSVDTPPLYGTLDAQVDPSYSAARDPIDARGGYAALVTNINDPLFDEPREHPGFRCRRARLGRQAGGERLGLSLWELPAGEAACHTITISPRRSSSSFSRAARACARPRAGASWPRARSLGAAVCTGPGAAASEVAPAQSVVVVC